MRFLQCVSGFKPIFLIVSLMVLGGCAQFPKQAFNKAAHDNVRHIALLSPAKSDDYTVYMAHHPGMSFGLIGGIIAAADMQSKSSEFTAKLKEREFDFAARLTDAIEAELLRQNFKVTRVNVTREKPELLTDYSVVKAEADAYLDWVINWQGYLTAAATTDYTPSARVAFRLVTPQKKEVIYSELIGYGFQIGASQAVTLPADAKYTYSNFSKLISSIDEAVAGLSEGVPLISKQVGIDLARQ
jgi:hypothetical protein